MGNCCTKVTTNTRIDITLQKRGSTRKSIVKPPSMFQQMDHFEEKPPSYRDQPKSKASQPDESSRQQSIIIQKLDQTLQTYDHGNLDQTLGTFTEDMRLDNFMRNSNENTSIVKQLFARDLQILKVIKQEVNNINESDIINLKFKQETQDFSQEQNNEAINQKLSPKFSDQNTINETNQHTNYTNITSHQNEEATQRTIIDFNDISAIPMTSDKFASKSRNNSKINRMSSSYEKSNKESLVLDDIQQEFQRQLFKPNQTPNLQKSIIFQDPSNELQNQDQNSDKDPQYIEQEDQNLRNSQLIQQVYQEEYKEEVESSHQQVQFSLQNDNENAEQADYAFLTQEQRLKLEKLKQSIKASLRRSRVQKDSVISSNTKEDLQSSKRMNDSSNQSYVSDEDESVQSSFQSGKQSQVIENDENQSQYSNLNRSSLISNENSLFDNLNTNTFNVKTMNRQMSNESLYDITPKFRKTLNNNLALKRINSSNNSQFSKQKTQRKSQLNIVGRNSMTNIKPTMPRFTGNRRNSDVSDAGSLQSFQDPFNKNFNYKAVVEGDQIDKMLENFVRTHKVKVPINYIDESRYLFGTKLLNAQIINGVLMVRVGGGFMELEEYVNKHSQKEIFKLRAMMAKDKVKLPKITAELIEKLKTKKFF